MPKIFTAIDSVLVPASTPHPPNTEYKISIGYEDWNNANPVKVLKIQMVYDGKISGRRSPSYPLDNLNATDYIDVRDATDKLLKKNGFQI